MSSREDKAAEAYIEDVTCVGAFLAMIEKTQPGMTWNAYTGAEAFSAFARVINVPEYRLRSLARDPVVDEIIKKAGGY